jgi:hypothetical protein
MVAGGRGGRKLEDMLRVKQRKGKARRKIAAWRREYNEERPHSSLGYRTPAEFAAAVRSTEGCGKDGGSSLSGEIPKQENRLVGDHITTAIDLSQIPEVTPISKKPATLDSCIENAKFP